MVSTSSLPDEWRRNVEMVIPRFLTEESPKIEIKAKEMPVTYEEPQFNCPKCGFTTKQNTRRYVKGTLYPKTEEHLHVTCGMCKYEWDVPCVDAQVKVAKDVIDKGMKEALGQKTKEALYGQEQAAKPADPKFLTFADFMKTLEEFVNCDECTDLSCASHPSNAKPNTAKQAGPSRIDKSDPAKKFPFHRDDIPF